MGWVGLLICGCFILAQSPGSVEMKVKLEIEVSFQDHNTDADEGGRLCCELYHNISVYTMMRLFVG
jgi:hypothetical protein